MIRLFVPTFALAVAFAIPARADLDGCTFHVAPQVTLAVDGPTDLLTNKPMLMGHWSVNSTGECAPNWQNVAQLTVVYAGDPSKFAFDGSASEIDQNQSGETQLDNIIGAKVTGSFTGWCYDPLQSSDHVTVPGNTVVVPPYMPPAEKLFAVAPFDGSAGSTADGFDGEVNDIPVGMPFRLMGLMIANPHGSEVATIHIEGAGVHFSKSYGYKEDADGKALDFAAQYGSDPQAFAKATSAGDLQAWLEYEGTLSDKVTLHAVAASSTSGDGSSSGDGSNGGSDAAGASGCASVGVGGFALVAVGLRRKSRR